MKTEVMTRLFNENGEQVITSLDIAKLTGKEHRNVLRDIKNMEPAWEQLHQLKFEQMQIKEKLPNNGYRMRKVYINRMLVKEGVQFFNGGRYKLTPEFEGKGYAKERSFHYYGLEGDKKERIYLVWTPEGVEYVTYLYYLTN